jgi:hypothetical protein
MTAGVHELVVFARDERGVVPRSAGGELAFDRCRFEIDGDGAVRLPTDVVETAVLLSPEGTLHGAVSDPALLQVAGGSLQGITALQIERPDGGAEVHELSVAQDTASPHALYDVSGLQNGDYAFALLPPSNASSFGGVRAGGSEPPLTRHRFTVNREHAGVE